MSHVIAPLLLIGSSAKINLMSWKSFPGTQAPASALLPLQRAGQQLPRCPVAAAQQPRAASAGRQRGFRLVLPSCQNSRAGGVQECVQGCSPSREQAAPSYPVTAPTAESKGKEEAPSWQDKSLEIFSLDLCAKERARQSS